MKQHTSLNNLILKDVLDLFYDEETVANEMDYIKDKVKGEGEDRES